MPRKKKLPQEAKRKVQPRPPRRPVKVAVPDEPKSTGGKLGTMALRRMAGNDYICSAEAITLTAMLKLPLYSSLSLTTLGNWSSKDRWVERRKEWSAAWAKKTEDALGTQYSQARIAEMKALERMQKALEKTSLRTTKKGDATFTLKPRSLEGFIRSRLDIGERLDALRSYVMDLLPQHAPSELPAGNQEPRLSSVHPNLRLRPTQDEALAMIRALLDVRAAEQQRRMAVYEAEVIEAEQPMQLEAPTKKKKPPPRDPDDEEEG